MQTYSKRRLKKVCNSFFLVAARTGEFPDLYVFKRQKPETTEELFTQGMAGRMTYEMDQEFIEKVYKEWANEPKQAVSKT